MRALEVNQTMSAMYSQLSQQIYHDTEDNMDLCGLTLRADIADGNRNIIDPRLQSSMSTPDALTNTVQPNALLSDTDNFFLNMDMASNFAQNDPFLGCNFAAPYRSTTPLSQTPSVASDTLHGYGRGSPRTHGNMPFMFLPRNYVPLQQAPTLSSPSLTALSSPCQTQLRKPSYSSESFDPQAVEDAESDDLSEQTPYEYAYTLESQYPEPTTSRITVGPTPTARVSPQPCIKSEPDDSPNARLTNRIRGKKERSRSRVVKLPPASGNTDVQAAAAVRAVVIARLTCKLCAEAYGDIETLEEHIRTEHNRPFICLFHQAGCQSSFTTKNEWKRHVNAQHLQATYFVCTLEGCAGFQHPVKKVISRAEENIHGKVFNRKDLFDSHIKRMHNKNGECDIPKIEWARKIRSLRSKAMRRRCNLPQYMNCPADDCHREFTGVRAWEERMEHIARHMERAAAAEEQHVRFGPKTDPALWSWASTPDAGIVQRTPFGWELCLRKKTLDSRSSSQETESHHDNEDVDGSDG